MSVLRAEGLELAYEDRIVVSGLDVEIPRGRLTAVVGANGCGKSTLLRALARLLRPRAGSVLLDGRSDRRARHARRRAAARDPPAVAGRARRPARSRTWSRAAATRTSGCSGRSPDGDAAAVERGAGGDRRRATCARARWTSSPAASASAPGSR